MDVRCATCREPFDTVHLREDAIFETGLDTNACDAFRDNGSRLTPEIRAAFAAAGYTFAGSVLALLRCPVCPAREGFPADGPAVGPKGAAARAADYTLLAELLGDDEDGLACMLEDYGG